MNPARRPVVAYTMSLSESEYGPEYGVKCDAYGLEMNIDDEWPIDTILMAPPDLVDVITDETDVTSMGTVFVGAASPPSDGDFQTLAGSAATWVLLENADAVVAALSAGLKVILCVEPSTDLAPVLESVPAAADQIILAITHEFSADSPGGSGVCQTDSRVPPIPRHRRHPDCARCTGRRQDGNELPFAGRHRRRSDTGQRIRRGHGGSVGHCRTVSNPEVICRNPVLK